jgi:hypothetical protein
MYSHMFICFAAYKIHKKQASDTHYSNKKVTESNEDGETAKPQAGILLETNGYFVCLLLLAILRRRQNAKPSQ